MKDMANSDRNAGEVPSEKDAPLSRKSMKSFRRAAVQGNLVELRRLWRSSDQNRMELLTCRNIFGATTMHSVCRRGRWQTTAVIQFLLNCEVEKESYRCDVDRLVASRNVFQRTPLHDAVGPRGCRIDYSLIERLLQAGADPNAQDKWGNTSLHYLASNSAYHETVLLTLDEHYATLKEAGEWHDWSTGNVIPYVQNVVRLLIEWGASELVKNHKGRTVLDVGMETRRTDSIPPG